LILSGGTLRAWTRIAGLIAPATLVLTTWCIESSSPDPSPRPLPAADQAPAPPDDSLNRGLIITGLSGVTWRSRDDETFRRRAAALAAAFGFAVREVFSARQMLDTLAALTRRRGALPLVYLIAHGDSNGIFFAPQNGLYHERILDPGSNPDDLYGGGPEQAFYAEWEAALGAGKIRLGGGLALVSCFGSEFAERTARAGRTFVLAAVGKCGPLNDGEHETGAYLADVGFAIYPYPVRPFPVFIPQSRIFPLAAPPFVETAAR
jgi:hypothetical protein